MEMGADDYLEAFEATTLNAIEVRLKKHNRYKNYSPDLSGFDTFIKGARQVLNMKELGKDRKTKSYKKKVAIFQEGDLPSNILCQVRQGQSILRPTRWRTDH